MVKIIGISVRFPKEAFNQKLDNGNDNPFWADIEIATALGNLTPTQEGDDVWITGITNTERFPPDKITAIIAGVPVYFPGKTAEIYNYPTWIQLPVGAHDDDVPEITGLPEVIVTPATQDNEAVVRPRKWSEVSSVSGTVLSREVEGIWYAPCSNGHSYWTGSVIVGVLQAVTGSQLILSPPSEDVGTI